MSQLLANVFSAELGWKPVATAEDGSEIRAGAAFVSNLVEGTAVDVWGAERGLIGGVTTDEIFVVLEGRAEVTFADTGETITIGPGDIVRLYAGQENTWRTFEPIRKVSFYVPPAVAS